MFNVPKEDVLKQEPKEARVGAKKKLTKRKKAC